MKYELMDTFLLIGSFMLVLRELKLEEMKFMNRHFKINILIEGISGKVLSPANDCTFLVNHTNEISGRKYCDESISDTKGVNLQVQIEE